MPQMAITDASWRITIPPGCTGLAWGTGPRNPLPWNAGGDDTCSHLDTAVEPSGSNNGRVLVDRAGEAPPRRCLVPFRGHSLGLAFRYASYSRSAASAHGAAGR